MTEQPTRLRLSASLEPEARLLAHRVALRPVSERDIAALVSYRSLPEVCRYVPFEPMDADDVRARIRGRWACRAMRSDGDVLFFGVELAATGTLIGDVQISCASLQHLCGEIGYVLNPAYAGHGYATEAVHRLLHLAFDDLGFRRMLARVDADNAASARLAARLGMRQEAHLVQNEWFKGRWSDELDFAMLESEWRAIDHASCKQLN